MKPRLTLIALGLVAVLCIGICAGYLYYTELRSQSHAAPTELRVFLAGSMERIVTDNRELFETENNARLLFNAAGSNSLYAQIIEGSSADVYMAADFKWLNQLEAGGLLYEDRYWNLTSNILVVVMPSDNPKNITSLLDLVKPDVRIVIAGWNVPAGKYTNITLDKIDRTWGSPTNLKYKGAGWEDYKTRFIQNIISYETNVELVVTKVVLGNCDAGVVYASDAKTIGGSKLKQIEIPAEVNTPGIYAIGIVQTTAHLDLAMKYVNFWLSDEGQVLLTGYGFGQNLAKVRSSIWVASIAENPHCQFAHIGVDQSDFS